MISFLECLGGLSIFCAVLAQVSGVERTFYVGIREEEWDYAPGGQNLINGKRIAEDE